MKRYLVDTNVPSELTRERPDARVTAFLQGIDKSNVFLSVMTIGEIRKGISSLPESQKRAGLESWLNVDLRSWFAGRILPVTEQIAEKWGDLAATRRQRGMPPAVVDGVIAATALHHDLTVVTRNVSDFAGLGIDLLNPWEQ